VPRQSRAPAARQNMEAIVEMRRQIPKAKDADSRRSQLKRKRNTVQPATNLQNCRHVPIGDTESIHCRSRTLLNS
jgi:hypothetical protein